MKRLKMLAIVLLLGVVTLGSTCQRNFSNNRDREITMIREVLLLGNDVVNMIDDMQVEVYDGSDEAFKRLERGTCILESMQGAISIAWETVRIYELAKRDYERKVMADTTTPEDQRKLTDLGIKAMSYMTEVAKITLLAYDLYEMWSKRPPGKLDSFMDVLRKLIGHDVEPATIDCSEVISWTPLKNAA